MDQYYDLNDGYILMQVIQQVVDVLLVLYTDEMMYQQFLLMNLIEIVVVSNQEILVLNL